ncbi:MAG: N-acetyltransferase, partial [Terrimicrobiaceae bacterium]
MFERVAERLHGADPAFIPPFPGSIAKYLSPESAFHVRHGEIKAFIATRDGCPVGRIAAITNRSHNERYSDKTGFFGFFECENNPHTAAMLFRKAADVLRAAGMDRMRGPYNPSINDECGMLAEKFDKPPCIGLTWNPEYYLDLLAGEGFEAVRTLRGINLPMHSVQQSERLGRIVERIGARSKLNL